MSCLIFRRGKFSGIFRDHWGPFPPSQSPGSKGAPGGPLASIKLALGITSSFRIDLRANHLTVQRGIEKEEYCISLNAAQDIISRDSPVRTERHNAYRRSCASIRELDGISGLKSKR